MSTLRKPFLALLMAAFSVSLGYGMIAPYLGSLARAGVANVTLGILSASYPIAKAFGFLASSLLPRQPRLQYLLILACIAYSAMALVPIPEIWTVARFAEGLAFGWLMGLAARSIVKDVKQRIGERLAWFNAVSSASVFCGPLLAWLAIYFHCEYIAFFAAASLCAVVCLNPSLPVTIHTPKTFSLPSILRAWPLVLCFFLFDFTYGILSVALPLAFASAPDAGAGLTTFTFSAGFVIFLVGLPLFGRMHDKGIHRLLEVALIAVALVFAYAAIVHAGGEALAGLIILEYVAAAAAYAAAAAWLGQQLPEGLGIAGTMQSLGLALGAILGGLISIVPACFLLATAYGVIGIVWTFANLKSTNKNLLDSVL